MKPQDVALWIGIASSIGGAAVGYGTLTEKVSTLEASTDATYLEARLTKLETRIEDNDIGKIGTEIQQLRGEIEKLDQRVSAIRVPSTVTIKSDVRLLQEQVKDLKIAIKTTNDQIKAINSKPDNPLL
jgi:chromosome segregation ATPase